MLTKSKVLSNTGLEVNAGKVLVNNNISLGVNQTSEKQKHMTTREVEGITVVQENPYDKIETQPSATGESPDSSSLTVKYEEKALARDEVVSELELLKRILRLHLTNMVKIDGRLVLKSDDLIDLIKYMTSADEVSINVDYEINCCGSSKGLNSISKILIMKSETVVDMKYKYNEQYNSLLTYGISLSYTFD